MKRARISVVTDWSGPRASVPARIINRWFAVAAVGGCNQLVHRPSGIRTGWQKPKSQRLIVALARDISRAKRFARALPMRDDGVIRALTDAGAVWWSIRWFKRQAKARKKQRAGSHRSTGQTA